MELKKYLITGSRGFVGSHLTSYIASQGGIEIIEFEGNLLEKESIRLLFGRYSITGVIHLAGAFEGDLDKQISLNFETTKNLLEIMYEFGVHKIVFASSGAVYGEPENEISYETDICKPNTWYGFSKKIAEDIILYYSRNYGFSSVILRFPNIYGPGSHWVISSFLSSIHESGTVTLYGNWLQSRNFLYIDDATRAIFLALWYEWIESIFNITNPSKISIQELISLMGEKYSFELVSYPQNKNKLRDLLLSQDKAKEMLWFEAQYRGIIF